MNRSQNLCQFVGNVGRDPEMRYTASGTAVVNLSLAVDAPRKVGDKWEKGVQWVRITMFGPLAERANRFIQKGFKLLVQAHFRSSQYTTEGGETKWSNEFIVDEWSIMAYPRDHEGDTENGGTDDQPEHGMNVDENDIPF